MCFRYVSLQKTYRTAYALTKKIHAWRPECTLRSDCSKFYTAVPWRRHAQTNPILRWPALRIKRIRRLRECGIFRDFNGDALPEFARFNLVYGQNWSGKTTISRVLRSLELREVPDGEVLISTDEPSDIRGSNFPSAGIPVRVFNSDFVRDNVFSIEGKDIPPIIILGTEDKKKRDRLEEKRADLERAKGVRDADRATHARAEKDADDHCITQGRLIKEALRVPGGGDNYGNYDKKKYRKRAENILAEGSAETYLREDGTQSKIHLHRAAFKPEIPEPQYAQPNLAALREKIATQLARTVVSGTIRSLRDDPERAKWVQRGLGLQTRRECPFCEQQVPEQRHSDLERHFSTEYNDIMESLDVLAAEINDTAESYLSELVAPDNAKIHDHLSEAYEEAKAALGSYHDQVKEYLDSLAGAVRRKKDRLFDKVPMDGMPLPPDGSPKDLIGIIRQHNDTCKNRARKAAEAGEWLECRYVAESLDEFRQMRDAVAEAGSTAAKSEQRVAVLNAEVSRLEREVSDHGRSADAFNADLSAYLGHEELRLDVRENGYIVVRKGNADPRPSEGEKTAIALLYFLTSLQRDGFDIGKSIVVLDDPISSLDASSLFAAHGFIQKHTKLAGQLFILTHNFTFFREVREWFDKKNHKKVVRAQFYMLDSTSDGQGRHSEIRKLDSLLKDYGSDYHYLFARVLRGSKQTDNLESYYPLPNMARRLLEAFLAFRLPDIRGTLGDRIDTIGFDEGRKRRILAFANAHSHNDAVAEQEHDVELLAEAPEVLADIMDLIKDMDSEHFDRMVKLTDPA